MNDVRPFPAKQAIKFPYCHKIFMRDLATHFPNEYRIDVGIIGEVPHVIFASRDRSGDENRFIAGIP
jgi:hypothetical protein